MCLKIQNFASIIIPSSFFRLAITLRFLASGDNYPSLSYLFRVGVSTICEVIRDTCCVIWNELQPQLLPVLEEEELKTISKDFLKLWSLPNCIGAIDGKHVIMQAPCNTGSYILITKNLLV